MSTLLRTLFFTMLISISQSSFTATEFEGLVPIELLKALLVNTTMEETGIYTDILAEFPKFDIPRGFELVGSVDQGHLQQVVLKTELQENDAARDLIAAFEDVDFVLLELFPKRGAENGFLRPVPFPVFVRMCRDDIGGLSMSFSEFNVTTLVSLRIYLRGSNNLENCAQQVEQLRRGFERWRNTNSGVNQYMPVLEAPSDSELPPFGGGLNQDVVSSLPANQAESSTTLTIDRNIDETYAHYSKQIEEQGWELVSNDIDTTRASGKWSLNPDPNLRLIGTLAVVKTAESKYTLSFKILAIKNESK